MTEGKLLRGWHKALLIIIPFIIFLAVFQLIGGTLAGVDYSDDNFQRSTFQNLIIYFSGLVGTLLILWIFMRFIDRERFIKLGFKFKGKLKEFNAGWFLGLCVMASGFLCLAAFDQINFVDLQFKLEELIYLTLLFMVVSVLEETIIRGYILKNLMSSFNDYAALITSSAVFALMHIFNDNLTLVSLLNLFLAGILLGTSYLHTQNLWFPIGLHLGWNLFQSLFGFNVSGMNAYSVIEIEFQRENYLSGGSFGFEGSLLCILAQIVLIIAIEIYYRKKNRSISVKFLND